MLLDELIKRYQTLDENSRAVINYLALTHYSLHVNEIGKAFPAIKRDNLTSIIEREKASGLIDNHNHYSSAYITDLSMSVWLFPLICTDIRQIYTLRNYYSYNYVHHKYLLNYLYALCYYTDELDVAEENFLSYSREQVRSLSVILLQPAYNKHIHKVSNTIIETVYSDIFADTIRRLTSFEYLQCIDAKLQKYKTKNLNLIRTEVAIVQGDFEHARKLSSLYSDEHLNYYVDAIFAFIDGNIDDVLLLIEKGLKKQRRKYKNRYLPVLPAIALFYLSACMSKGQEFYTPVFHKIIEERESTFNNIHLYFRKVCEYCVVDVKTAEQIALSMNITRIGEKESELLLWNAVALGLMDKPVEAGQYVAKYVRQAVENKHYVLAYETAYLLTKWFPKDEYKQLFDDIAAKLHYSPALSYIKHPDEWEKQLNSYFSLEAVQMITKQDVDNSKTRVAYRFFPEKEYVCPILQTRNSAGIWTAGRNIAMKNFVDKKVECMTEQDKRIASCETNFSYSLKRNAIFEMIGHPYVYLENTAILVELIAAQPIINVVKSSGKSYTMKSDISIKDIDADLGRKHEGIIIRKETNTRYKVYNITKYQYDIISAISNSKPVPVRGYEKLMQILKHFSTYIQIQSDLVVDENDVQLRQVDTDSRIRVQLLPVGEGLKAELFVKPFGSYPPYCKPGRGGKALITTENGERVRVTRSLDDETAFNTQILNDIQSIENIATSDDGLMTFDNPLDALELLDILERHHDISVVEWPEGEQLKIRKKITVNDLSISVKSNVSWFELEGELKIDENTVLTISKLLEMMRHGHGRCIELNNGEFLALSDQLRRRLSEFAAFTSESKKGVVINRFASASIIDAFDEFENLKVDKAWRDFRKRLQTVQLSEAAVPSLLQAELRPYQLSGYQWMIRLSEWGAGACLADDMGLGKTVQAIAVLLHRAHTGVALVVSPVSVMPNWISEVNRFAPSLNIKTLRNVDRAATLDSLEAGDVLITSYGLLLSEEKTVTAKQWSTVILDEAHAIKNYNTKTSKAAMSLQADFRMILTGTPIQNHLGEMWNLFQFINPGLLGSLSHFIDTFIRTDDEKSRKRLKKLIAPFILRRTKSAVLEELPPKTEIIRKITLSDEEIAFYEMLRRQAIESLENDESPQGAKHLKVLAEITRLRQACCNPSLVYPDIAIESTKLSTFLEIAAELKENGHRALVFSQFVTHLSIVRKAMDKAGYTYCYLDGSTPVAKRESEVRNFQNGQKDFFLISLKAGGLGLNLTAADYVIHLDPWWNPAIEDQASDRAHRIGQNRPVTVYRLVAEQTIEEKIIQLHNTKRDLADSLLEGSDQSAKMSINELLSLIKE
jgi:SNF2 family DNA or RNA helicase